MLFLLLLINISANAKKTYLLLFFTFFAIAIAREQGYSAPSHGQAEATSFMMTTGFGTSTSQ
jgi:hypothetical protein